MGQTTKRSFIGCQKRREKIDQQDRNKSYKNRTE